jgi:hypothetical protein
MDCTFELHISGKDQSGDIDFAKAGLKYCSQHNYIWHLTDRNGACVPNSVFIGLQKLPSANQIPKVKSWDILLSEAITIYRKSDNYDKSVMQDAEQLLDDMESDPKSLVSAGHWNNDIVGVLLSALAVLLREYNVCLRYLNWHNNQLREITLVDVGNIANPADILLIQHSNSILPHFDVLLPKVTE